jgi:hypothetical protein
MARPLVWSKGILGYFCIMIHIIRVGKLAPVGGKYILVV